MILSDLTMPEIRMYLAECNFTKEEREVFLRRTKAETIESISEELFFDISTTKRISQKIVKKIHKVDTYLRP